MLAKKETEAAGKAFANRAVILAELGHFEDALQDVKLAFANGYPTKDYKKLEERKAKYQESIDQKQNKYSSIKSKLTEELEQMRIIRDDMLVLKKPSPLIPVAAESVEINYNDNQGRHLVVNQDVAPGNQNCPKSCSLLLIEKKA